MIQRRGDGRQETREEERYPGTHGDVLGENHFQKYLYTIPLQARALLFYKHARARARTDTHSRENQQGTSRTRGRPPTLTWSGTCRCLKTLWTRLSHDEHLKAFQEGGPQRRGPPRGSFWLSRRHWGSAPGTSDGSGDTT